MIPLFPNHLISRPSRLNREEARVTLWLGRGLKALTILLLAHSINKAYNNYQLWLAIGPGGLPYNIIGWLAQLLILPFGRTQLRSSKVFHDPEVVEKYGPLGATRFLKGELPRRAGLRPFVPSFVAPQRQGPGWGNDARVQELQHQLFNTTLTSNPTLLTTSTSKAERRGTALFLHPHLTSPPHTSTLANEIAHFHLFTSPEWANGEPDGSGHVVLSLADAAEVVEKGWGQMHMLSGKMGWPHGFVLVYAPRDEGEVEVLGRVLRAGVAYMSGGQEVE